MVFYTRIFNYLFWLGLLACVLQFCIRVRRRRLETRTNRESPQVTAAVVSTSTIRNSNNDDEGNEEISQRLRSEVLNAMFPEQKLDKNDLLLNDEESNNFNCNDESYGESSCSICLETFEPGDAVVSSCHVYHRDCILGWLQKRDDCPNCRQCMWDTETYKMLEEAITAINVGSKRNGQ
mmetsp:Transcript_4041/g.6311  ORF Transcript_4041/g.6311 Transcript_4041/m.6311 type:complete len:179 (+) Transcript_4041:157-693(+)